jgi:hypothetical protein
VQKISGPVCAIQQGVAYQVKLAFSSVFLSSKIALISGISAPHLKGARNRKFASVPANLFIRVLTTTTDAIDIAKLSICRYKARHSLWSLSGTDEQEI